MTLKYGKQMMLVVGAVMPLAVIAAACSQFLLPVENPAPDLNILLGVSGGPVAHLYPDRSAILGTKLPAVSRSVSIPAGTGAYGTAGQTRFATLSDDSTEDAALTADGQIVLGSQSYYAVPRGELGRHPHSKKTFAIKDNVLIDDDVRWYSGKRKEHLHVNDDGSKQIVDYAEDGDTVLDDRLYDAPEYRGVLPVLRSEQRFRADQRHTLSYSDQVNGDDTRTVTNWDERHLPERIIVWAHKDPRNIAGTTVVGYFPYPKNLQILFQGGSDAFYDTVSYYRENRSLSYIVKIGSSNTEIEYYDASGTKVWLDQTFARHKTADGENEGQTEYVLTRLKEFDADGQVSRELFFSGGSVSLAELSGAVTLDGVLYRKVAYGFDRDGNVIFISHFTNISDTSPQVVDRDPPPQKHYQIDVPDDERRPKVRLDEDLPVPPPQTYTPTG